MRFFNKAMGDNNTPEKVTMDKGGANKAAIEAIIENRNLPMVTFSGVLLSPMALLKKRVAAPWSRVAVNKKPTVWSALSTVR